MPRSQFHVPDLKMIEQKILTLSDFRVYVTPGKAGNREADNKWMSTLKCSSIACLKLVEDILYTTNLNGAMIALLRKGKGASPLELMEIETFSLRWKAAVAAKDNEIAAERALDGKQKDQEVEEETDECKKIALGSLQAEPSKYQRGSAQRPGLELVFLLLKISSKLGGKLMAIEFKKYQSVISFITNLALFYRFY